MNRAQLLSALVALLAITSLSVASTTLETSLTTDPADEINPNWDDLPIGQGDAAAIQESIGDGAADGSRDSEAGGGGDVSDSSSDSHVSGDPAGADEVGDSGGGGAAGSVGDGGGAGGGSADDSGSASDDRSLFDRLVALLSVLFRLLLPAAAILVVAALAYRYRDVLAGFFGRDSRTTRATGSRPAGGRWPATAPKHDVDQAWVEVVCRLNPERPETMTPDECRALARRRGVDRDAVESIVAAFERVHYGGGSVDTEIGRARDGLSRLEDDVK